MTTSSDPRLEDVEIVEDRTDAVGPRDGFLKLRRLVVRNRYGAGAGTNVEVLDAEALREQSLSNRDSARFELALAKLRLARATGSL